MLFKRRVKRGFFSKALGLIVPQGGWKRSARYIGHRVARLPGSSTSIAIGFACGAAASFTPLVGFHFLLAAFLAWAMRGNLIASAIGTAVGNPWTFPFIWYTSWRVGDWMIGSEVPFEGSDFSGLFYDLWNAVTQLDGVLFLDGVWPIWKVMLVGSVPLAVLSWLICYWPVQRAVASYQKARVMRRHKAASEQANRVNAPLAMASSDPQSSSDPAMQTGPQRSEAATNVPKPNPASAEAAQ